MADRVEVSEAEGDVTADEPLDELAALDHGASTSLALTLSAYAVYFGSFYYYFVLLLRFTRCPLVQLPPTRSCWR